MSKASVAIASTIVLAAGGVVVGGIAASFPEQCESPYQPGKASALVEASTSSEGAVGASYPTPLKTTGRELSVLIPGDGEPAFDEGFVDFDLNVFLGSTGEFITASDYAPGNPVRRVVDSTSDDFFSTVLECQLPGSQIVITTTVEDVFGPIEGDESISNESTIVLVVDVHQTYPQKADGDLRLPLSGMPTVVQTDDGVHGISFPNAPLPTELRVSVLKQGDGVAIQEGDFVTTHFTAAVWNTREIFNTSFERGIPLTLVARDSFTTGEGLGVIPGVAQALIGQSVGSQVLVAIPPSLGYPAGAAPAGVPEGATLVYVFDILGTSK
jgi:peptidylprolyl isomerase